MIVFLAIAVFAALLNTALINDPLGAAIAYAVVGGLCGLVLRTRLEGGVARMLVVCFFAIGFAVGGFVSMMSLLAPVPLADLAGTNAMIWAVIGFAVTTPYLGTHLGPTLVAVVCFGAAGGLSIVLIHEVFTDMGELFVNPILMCLGAAVFDQTCGRLGLESPEREFERLRVKLEFRLR